MARAVRTLTRAKAPARAPKANASLKPKPGARRKASVAKTAAATPAEPSPERASVTMSAGYPGGDMTPPGSEEEQIESSKYQSRHVPPKRLFEEERFLFPETYGTNRVRLLVKDPEWLFAHWDVDRKVLTSLAQDLGARTMALARLTLKIADPAHGGTTVILLPPGVRGWYVHADSAPRTYRAELGLTLPSGEFRHLADSNTVTTPRVGPAPEGARRKLHFRSDRSALAGSASASGSRKEPGPWLSARMDGHEAAPVVRPRGKSKDKKGARRGGASDVYRR